MEEKPIKPNSKKKWIYVVSAIFVVGLGGYILTSGINPFNNSVKVPFPYVNSVASNTSFACESLLSTLIVGNSAEYSTDGIEASASKGTDTVAMTIKDEKTLVLQTAVSVSLGSTEGDNFQIIQNSENKLMAIWFSENAISTVVLNKDSGLAAWLKGVPDPIMDDAPFVTVIYMACQ